MIYATVALALSAAFSLVLLKIVDGRFRTLEASRSVHLDILNKHARWLRELQDFNDRRERVPADEPRVLKRLAAIITEATAEKPEAK